MDRSIQINLNGVFYTVSNAVRIMKKEGRANGRTGGSIVTTASNAGLVTEPIVGLPYMPAKAGVLHMVRALGLELAEFGIRINAIAPGPFVTNIGGGWLKKDPVARAAWDAIVPLGSVAETDQIKPLAPAAGVGRFGLHDRQPRGDRWRHDARQVQVRKPHAAPP